MAVERGGDVVAQTVGLVAEHDGGGTREVGLGVRRAPGGGGAQPLPTEPTQRVSASTADHPSDSASTTGIPKIAPADARTTLGLYASTDPGPRRIAAAPDASALRTSVPRLPGSESATPTTTRPSAPSASLGGGGHARHRQHRLRGAGAAHLLQHAFLEHRDLGAGGRDPCRQRGEGDVGAGPEVHRVEARAAVERGVDRARPFHHEGPLRRPGPRVAQQLAQPLDRAVARPQGRCGVLLRQLRAPRARCSRARRRQPSRAPRGRRGSCGRRRSRPPSGRRRSASRRCRSRGRRR